MTGVSIALEMAHINKVDPGFIPSEAGRVSYITVN